MHRVALERFKQLRGNKSVSLRIKRGDRRQVTIGDQEEPRWHPFDSGMLLLAPSSSAPHLLLFPFSCFLTDLHCFSRWFRESRGLLWQRSVWNSRPIVKIWEVSRNRRSRLSVGRSPVCLCTSLFIVQMYIVYHTPSRLNNIYVSPSVSPFIAVHYTMKFSVPLWTSTIGLCTTLPSVVYEQFWRTPVSVPGVPPSLLQTVAEIWEIIPTLKSPKCFSVPNLNLKYYRFPTQPYHQSSFIWHVL